jgi:hypothetical protein
MRKIIAIACLFFAFPGIASAIAIRADYSGHSITQCADGLCADDFGSVDYGDTFDGTIFISYDNPQHVPGEPTLFGPSSNLSIHYTFYLEDFMIYGDFLEVGTDGASFFRITDESPDRVPGFDSESKAIDSLGFNLLSAQPASGTPYFPNDFSAFNGGTLNFVAYGGNSGWGFDFNGIIDDVSYSVTPVPEPGTLALLGVGLAAGLLRRKKRNRAV